MQRYPKQTHWIVLALATCVVATGCSSKPKPKPRAAVADSGPADNAEKPKVRDLFNLKSKALEYTYNPIGKRDPFKEFTGTAQVVAVDQGGPLTSYDIDQMKLVAVIWGISDPRGMLQLPDGKSYIIKRNSPIGKHYGKVARITPNALIIEEEFRGPLGDLQIKESKLVLREDESKGPVMSDEDNSPKGKPAESK